MNARIPFLAALSAFAFPLQVWGQAWVASPDVSEGIGIRVGDLELHPSIGGEFGYDSNFFRASENEGIVDVYRLRITPSFTISTLGKGRLGDATARQPVIFNAGAYLSYNEIFAADSSNSDVSEQRDVGLGANAKLNVFPYRKLGFDLGGAYVRAIDANGSVNDLVGPGFDRDTVHGAAGVTWRPGGGTFDWRLGYGITWNHFETEAYQELDNLNHEINTKGRWRFLPRSALLFDAAYGLVRYGDSATRQTDGDSVRARVGFHGLVTYHLSLLGMLGWASSFYEGHAGSIEPQQYDSLLANAEARWFLMSQPSIEGSSVTSGLSSVALGFARTFSNSYYGSFYQSDRGYLQFSMFLLGSVVGGLEFGVARVAYPAVVRGTFQQSSFDQVRLDGRLFGEYRFTDTFAANMTLSYDKTNSDPVDNEDLDYDRWQGFVGVRWFM